MSLNSDISEETYEVEPEYIEKVKLLIKKYPELNDKCIAFEKQNKMIFNEGNLDTRSADFRVFNAERFPEMLRGLMASYCETKADLCIIKSAINTLSEEQQDIAKKLIYERVAAKDIAHDLCLSEMTISRRKKEIINHIASQYKTYILILAHHSLGVDFYGTDNLPK